MKIRLTLSRRFRRLSWTIFGLWSFFIALSNSIASRSATDFIVSLTIIAVIGSALYVITGRSLSETRKDLVELHTDLLRKCVKLTSETDEYTACDETRHKAIRISRRRVFGLRVFDVAVGEPDDDADRYPDLAHSFTARVYSTSPGVADIRKYVETGVEIDNDLVVMDSILSDKSVSRRISDRLREPYEMNFAANDEIRRVNEMLETFQPVTWTD